MASTLGLSIIILIIATSTTHSARVLLVPQNVNSHIMYFSRLAEGLAQNGHTTTMLLASNAKPPKFLKQTSVMKYTVEEAFPWVNSNECSDLMVQAAFTNSFFELWPILKQIGDKIRLYWEKDCVSALDDEKLIQRLNDTKFELTIMDSSSLTCMYVLPYMLEVPYATFSAPFVTYLYRNPAIPSFVPSTTSEYSDRMDFMQRVKNVLYDIVGFASNLMLDSSKYSQKYAPGKEPRTAVEFLENSVLWFLLKDNAAYYPQPRMPNIIEIGDIVTMPAKPLPEELQLFMDQSQDGVILVSLGSFFDHMPDDLASKFCEAFSNVKQNVVWKLTKPPPCELPKNVKMMSWVPQNDLLGHENMRLFISHCGMNGLLEAVYHGVPILGFPISLDQPFNAAIVKHKGYGIQMRLADFTADQLVDNINEVVSNTTYKENVQAASLQMRHKPETAAERASFWVDHVVRYGDSHLRTSAYNLNLFQFYMIDIFLFLLAIIVVIVMVMCFMCYLTFKLLRRLLCRRGEDKLKKN